MLSQTPRLWKHQSDPFENSHSRRVNTQRPVTESNSRSAHVIQRPMKFENAESSKKLPTQLIKGVKSKE